METEMLTVLKNIDLKMEYLISVQTKIFEQLLELRDKKISGQKSPDGDKKTQSGRKNPKPGEKIPKGEKIPNRKWRNLR